MSNSTTLVRHTSTMPRYWSRAGLLAALIAIGWIGGCSDNPVGTDHGCLDCAPLLGLLVSDPVTGVAGTSGAASPRVAVDNDSVVYVALAPETELAGARATVRTLSSPATVTTAVENGGFDPVPIAATPGDTIEVVVRDVAGSVVLYSLAAVAAVRRPVVVRTQPPPGKRDVPLNAAIVVVFSEPLAPGSITPTSVRLQRGPSVIQGSVHPLQGSATGVVFVPDAPLAVNADYQLTATSALLDLDGDHLEGNVTVSFRTGSSVLGPVASVTLEPDSADVPVGSHFQLTVTARDSLGNVIAGRPVSWWSCDSSLVNVSAAGLVSALAEGSACVVAEIDGVQGVLTVGVSDALVPVASVTLTPESSMVRVADSITLQADIRDSSGQVVSRRLVQWASTNPSIATVTPTNGNGFGGDFAVVRGVSSGMARIVVAVEGKRDTAVVTVGVMGPIVALVLSPDSVSKVLLDTIRIQAFGRDAAGFLTPVNGSQVTWTSSDPTIANVDFSGQVRAARAGSATITGRFGFHQATARIDVVALTLTSISASGAHTCGVTGDGAAYCWGYGWDGELGTGKLGYGLLPQAVAGGLGFSEVGNTCGLADSGRAYCWGLDVGAPPAGCINGPCNLAPVPVAGLLRFLSIREGGIETCGLTTAHDVYCWRRGDTSSPPILVSGGLSFASISVGFQHACAITMDGAAYCWGGNYYGQLGTGDTVETGDTLQPVVGNLTFTALSAGDDHTCGLTPNGDVYCWGGNHYNGFNLWMPQPLAGFSFTQLSGTGHYTCGLDLSGSIRCWEWAGSQFTQPWTITTTLTFTKVSASDDHDCALTANNVAYCWGYNYAGQLGIGTMGETITVPVKVGGQP